MMYYIPDFFFVQLPGVVSFQVVTCDKQKKNLCGNIFPWPCVSPYIVYMLREMDILEDWAAIRKVYV